MSAEGITLRVAANGFSDIQTESHRQYQLLASLLVFRYGFIRWGIWIPPLFDEGVYPSFVRWQKRILAGYDNWSGYYLLASNAETDAFLKDFFARHCASGTAEAPGPLRIAAAAMQCFTFAAVVLAGGALVAVVRSLMRWVFS